jgi:site-specific DNA-methyltransferase (adenine-specific)
MSIVIDLLEKETGIRLKSDDGPHYGIFLMDSLEFLKGIPDNSVEVVFTDPPYFLSNGGSTVNSGKRVAVKKGEWDESHGAVADHKFYLNVFRECQRILKPNGSILITGTHHCIHSIGYALQELGFGLMQDIIWEKPNPPFNAGCRQFTDAQETIIWAVPKALKKGQRQLHTFNYSMLRDNNRNHSCKCGKVSRPGNKFCTNCGRKFEGPGDPKQVKTVKNFSTPSKKELWANDGKSYSCQKPVELIKYYLAAVTLPGYTVVDPFMGSGSTGVAAAKLGLDFLGCDLFEEPFNIAQKRLVGWREHE